MRCDGRAAVFAALAWEEQGDAPLCWSDGRPQSGVVWSRDDDSVSRTEIDLISPLPHYDASHNDQHAARRLLREMFVIKSGRIACSSFEDAPPATPLQVAGGLGAAAIHSAQSTVPRSGSEAIFVPLDDTRGAVPRS